MNILYHPEAHTMLKMTTCPNFMSYVIGQMKDIQGNNKFIKKLHYKRIGL
jgi:hypothetical protein